LPDRKGSSGCTRVFFFFFLGGGGVMSREEGYTLLYGQLPHPDFLFIYFFKYNNQALIFNNFLKLRFCLILLHIGSWEDTPCIGVLQRG
jgi:hypothetical protein